MKNKLMDLFWIATWYSLPLMFQYKIGYTRLGHWYVHQVSNAKLRRDIATGVLEKYKKEYSPEYLRSFQISDKSK